MKKPSSTANSSKLDATAITAGGSVGAAIGNAAATGDLATVITAALIASVGPTVAMLFQTVSTWSARATERWWEHVVSHSSPDLREEVEQRLLREQTHQRSPTTSTVISASVRTLLEGVDDDVVPILAALSAEYLREDRAVDQFFRAMARTLGDLDARGLRDLKRVTALCTNFEPPGVDLQQADVARDLWILHQAHEDYVDNPDHPYESTPFEMETGAEFVALMRRHGLAWESMTSFDRRNAFRCFIDLETANRIQRLVASDDPS